MAMPRGPKPIRLKDPAAPPDWANGVIVKLKKNKTNATQNINLLKTVGSSPPVKGESSLCAFSEPGDVISIFRGFPMLIYDQNFATNGIARCINLIEYWSISDLITMPICTIPGCFVGAGRISSRV